MKKIILSMFAIVALASCGGGDPAGDAKATCDCMIKANALSKAGDAKATEEMQKCSKAQLDAWNKYKENADDSKAFNDALSECSKEVMEESMK